MTTRIVCRIGGVDYGSAGQNLLMSLDSVSPMGPGGVGTATIGLRKAGGGVTITNQQVVELYEQEIGTNKIPRSYVMGIVNRRRTGVMRGTNIKVWAIDTVDVNDALDGIVVDAKIGITVASGTFTAQIASIYTQATAGTPPTVTIDYASGIVDPTGGATLPAVTFKGRTLRQMIQDRCNALQAINTALRMKFHIGPDTNPNRTTFGGPILYTYDAAASAPAIALWFTDQTPPGGGKTSIAQLVEFGRIVEGAKLIQKRQVLVKATGGIFTGSSAAGVISTYPYPYTSDGARWGELVEDSQSLTDADGQTAIARAVRSTGTPRETIQLSAFAYALPGQYAKLDWALEGLAGAIYSIAAVSVDFRNWRNPLTTFTLGARRLMLGENADLDELVMPIERDRVPPAAPLNWRESPASTYSAATRMSTVNLAFDGPQETDLEQVEVIVTINGVTQPMIRLARGILTLALVMLPSATWSAYASARDTSGNKSGPTATLTGTAAAMIAEVPGPPATVTLAGLRTGIDTWQANVSWSAGTGGTGTAATYEVRYYKTASGAASATILPVPTDNRVMLINGLALGVGYTINVRSVTAWGDRGGWSSGSTLTFSGETPGAPTISSVSSAKGAITFNIGKPTTGTGLTNIDRYSIGMAWYNGATLLGKEERIISYAGDPTGAAWMGVERGATYKFTVTALTRFDDIGTASAQTTYSVPAPTVEQTLYNPGFEIAALNNPTLPDGWTRNDAFNHVWSRATDQWYGGAASLKVVSGTNVGVGFSFEAQSQPFVVRPNTAYQITTMMRYNIATTTNQGFRVLINWLDNTGAAVLPGYSTAIVSGLTANTWNTVPITSSLPFVSPANAASAYILVQFTGAAGLTGWIDDIIVTRAAAPNEITTGVIDLPSKFGSAMAAIQKGTSNPAGMVAGDTIYRSDIRPFGSSDGTRVLTDAKPINFVLSGGNATPFPNTLGPGTTVYAAAKAQNLGWWLDRLDLAINVQTTNNVSNYWTVTLLAVNAAGTTTLATINTSALTAGTWSILSLTSFTGNPLTATGAYWLAIQLTKTATPGSIYIYPHLLIREVLL